MANAGNGTTRIHYEVEGQGDALVLVHGATVGLEMWQELGYTEALAPDYRLISIDARGHGQSDKPHEPAAYQPELLAGDILAVLDAAGVERAHYLGASLGAAIGFELACRAPGRLRSLVLLGYGRYGPLTDAQQHFHTAGLRLFGLGASLGGAAILAGMDAAGATVSPVMRAAYLANDWQALLALQEAFITWPDLHDLLPRISTPSLLIAAEGDPFYESARLCAGAIPGAGFLALPGGIHGQASYPADLVVPHVRALLAGVAETI